MRKFLPFVLFGAGVLVLVGMWWMLREKKPATLVEEEEEVVREVELGMRPVVSLTPRSDGHWLDMKIEDIRVEAMSMDYELLYETATGITQGVPGTVKLEGKTEVEREILLGSESSGKFRYDEGVEGGTLTLRFRGDSGKLIGKLTTEWHLQTGTDELTSMDGLFSFMLGRASDEYFVTMESFGLFGEELTPVAGPYGVFSSDPELTGTPEMGGTAMRYSASGWKSVTGAVEAGFFVGVGE